MRGIVVGLSVMAGLLLAVNAFNERGNVFGSPNSGARAKFDGLGIAARLAASPPRTFADGDESQNLRQTEKASGGNVGKHVNAPFADGKTKNALLGHQGQRSAWACCKRSAGLAELYTKHDSFHVQ